jgi:hypothetical protein
MHHARISPFHAKRHEKIDVTPRGPQGALPQERSEARSPVLEEYIYFLP